MGDRGACDCIEGMLCHRARVFAGFCVRGMMLCHRASPRPATCVRNDYLRGFSELIALFSGLCSSAVLTAARLCCTYGKPRKAFGLGGRVAGWMRRSPFLSSLCWDGLRAGRCTAWESYRGVTRAVTRCRVPPPQDASAAGEPLHLKQCSSGFHGNSLGYSVLTRGGRHVL